MTPKKNLEIPGGSFGGLMKKIWKDNWNKLEYNGAGIYLSIKEILKKSRKKNLQKRDEKTLEKKNPEAILGEESSPKRIFG